MGTGAQGQIFLDNGNARKIDIVLVTRIGHVTDAYHGIRAVDVAAGPVDRAAGGGGRTGFGGHHPVGAGDGQPWQVAARTGDAGDADGGQLIHGVGNFFVLRRRVVHYDLVSAGGGILDDKEQVGAANGRCFAQEVGVDLIDRCFGQGGVVGPKQRDNRAAILMVDTGDQGGRCIQRHVDNVLQNLFRAIDLTCRQHQPSALRFGHAQGATAKARFAVGRRCAHGRRRH